ncbi:MAG: PASTA domain-containing protein [Acidobacteria bacterium]|nr:PASTA domain-containing protein [Acidobacteriota bacterium]MBV9146176.1 PASTA domain-containing protein [Acidobacteriota bacterium]MBV9436781.1 PASTA domain-containing protein [Acidobacteriota bacterium]
MRFLRFVTRSLILLLIALFSALAAMRFAIHGREVRVPEFRGMSILQAQEAANDTGLTVAVEDKFYSSDVAEGKVISQAPPAKSRVRRGWRVRVAESLGPQRVSIPDLVGQTERAATLNLRQRGLDLATVSAVPLAGVPPEQVIAQLPPAGASGVLSPKMSLLLAQAAPPPEYVMPNFVGRSLTDVRDKVARAGLQIANVSLSGEAPPGTAASVSAASAARQIPSSGTVSRQNPPPGSRVTPETQITLEVAQ